MFLPGVALDARIRATAVLAEAAAADVLLLVAAGPASARAGRRACGDAGARRAGGHLRQGHRGRQRRAPERGGGRDAAATPHAVLSGPTFAGEVARGLPTAVTLACADAASARVLSAMLGSRALRPYLADDPIGAEIGGALKNVMAIACGIVVGRGLGENARAAIITRGLAEMVRLAQAKGGRPATLMGLCGLGDLTLTCTSAQSRNFSLGLALGQGRTLEAVLADRHSVAEGVTSAPAAVALAKRLGIEMPIAAAVDAILHRGAGHRRGDRSAAWRARSAPRERRPEARSHRVELLFPSSRRKPGAQGKRRASTLDPGFRRDDDCRVQPEPVRLDLLAQLARSVVGSIVLATSVILVAGKPLISACLRMIASSWAR